MLSTPIGRHRPETGATVEESGPFGVCNFEVELDGRQVGFAEVRGLGCEFDYTTDGVHCRVNAITLRRALLGDRALWSWVHQRRSDATDPRTVRITLMDATQSPVCRWELRRVRPVAWSGPSFDAMAAGQLATEELVIVADDIEYTVVVEAGADGEP
jgi:phage tail-like protein